MLEDENLIALPSFHERFFKCEYKARIERIFSENGSVLSCRDFVQYCLISYV